MTHIRSFAQFESTAFDLQAITVYAKLFTDSSSATATFYPVWKPYGQHRPQFRNNLHFGHNPLWFSGSRPPRKQSR